MALIDTHTHLETFARAGTLPAILARAKAAGLETMIAIGTSPDDWTLDRDLAREHAGFVRYAVGLHPCSVDAGWAAAVAQIEKFWESSGCGFQPQNPGTQRLEAAATLPVALGECGLDRFHLPKDVAQAEMIFAWQCAAFAAQLAIAKRLACPLVIHSRGAFRESVEMIDDALQGASRVERIVRALRELSRQQIGRREPTPAADAVTRAVRAELTGHLNTLVELKSVLTALPRG